MRTYYTEKSSRITAMEYDPETLELRVTFKRGGVYSYRGVPEEVYDTLLQSESLGQAINSFVKGVYPYEKS